MIKFPEIVVPEALGNDRFSAYTTKKEDQLRHVKGLRLFLHSSIGKKKF